MSFFFKLLLRIFDVVWQLQRRKRSYQDSVEMERFWNLQSLKFENYNGAKMIDVWNSNKITEARTNMANYRLESPND